MRSGNHNPAVARALLSAELRKLRAATNETQEVVSRACEWSLAKFSRIETGVSAIRKADLESLLRHYGVNDDRIEELTYRAREARAPGWWEDYDFGPDRVFQDYVGYEDGADSIRIWQPLVVPELIQIAQYTQQTMEAWGMLPKTIAGEVKLLEERQRRVANRSPEQCYLLDESVIRRPVGTAMSEQLHHLVSIAQKATVTIRIVPFAKGPHVGQRGAFALLGFDGPLDNILYIENARRGDLLVPDIKDQYAGPNMFRIDDPTNELARYKDRFEDLQKLALAPEDSLKLIEQVAEEFAS